MSQKGQKPVDEFAWVILGAVAFVLIITIIFSSGASTPVIEPKNLAFSYQAGSTQYFTITVRSDDGRSLSNVTLTPLGEIANWLSFDKNHFDATNSTTVRVRVDVPRSADFRTWTGSIKAETVGGSSLVPVSITVGNISTLTFNSRPITLGDFQIVYTKSSQTVTSQQSVTVSKGDLSETVDTFTVAIPSDKLSVTTDAMLTLSISDTNKFGNLIVNFNGQQIFNKNVDAGRVVIPVDKSLLSTNNTVTIKTEGPFPLFFWLNTNYNIQNVDFSIDVSDTSPRVATFTLNNNEVASFQYLMFQGRVTEYSLPLQDLLIKVNGQLVYQDRPPLAAFNATFTNDIFGNKILVGNNNTISFSFEKESYISLKDALVVVYFS